MSSNKELYFLALLPPQEMAERIHEFKKEMAEKYESRYSLKIPEHITIIPPFYCKDDDLNRLSNILKDFARSIQPFEVRLKDFGHFNSRVIFIPALSTPATALEHLYYSTKNAFQENLSFLESLKLSDEFVSHLTIANRDLKPMHFRKAWEEFKEKKFDESFAAEHLSLLRLDEGIWKKFEDFQFSTEKI